MKNCPHCGIEHQGGRSFGAHITNCKKNPTLKEKLIKIGNAHRIDKNQYTCKCIKCDNEYEIIVSEKNYLKENYKKYCSRKCANSHVRTEESKQKLSSLVKEKLKNGDSFGYIKLSTNIDQYGIKFYCKECNKEISNHTKYTLCQQCMYKSLDYRNTLSKSNKGKCGGYREKGGRGKQGYFNGIFCNSSWELAYLIYCKDHNINVIRNKEGFNYIFENNEYKFYPDFIVNNEYVEIKGYLDKKNIAKITQFTKPLLVLYKREMKLYINYVIDKYGNDFIKLYEPKIIADIV